MKSTILKLGLIFCYAFMLNSCQTQEKKIIVPVPEKVKVEKIIEEYIEKNPNWKNNDIILKLTCDSLEKIIIPLIADGLYDDIPLKFIQIQERDSTYIASFLFNSYKAKRHSIAYYFDLKVDGVVDKSMVGQLKDNETYFIKGTLDTSKFGETDIGHFDMKTPEAQAIVGQITLPSARLKISNIIPYK